MLGSLWLGLNVILSMQMKQTIRKYGACTHNRIKPLLVACLALPLCLGKHFSINFKFLALYIVIISVTIILSIVFNK